MIENGGWRVHCGKKGEGFGRENVHACKKMTDYARMENKGKGAGGIKTVLESGRA